MDKGGRKEWTKEGREEGRKDGTRRKEGRKKKEGRDKTEVREGGAGGAHLQFAGGFLLAVGAAFCRHKRGHL
jgi:hypothetical protein